MRTHRPPPLTRALIVAFLGLAVAACGRGADWRDSRAQGRGDDQDSGYARPPQALAAARGGDGSVVVTGEAAPGVRVRFASPDGAVYGATADAKGAWSLSVPRVETVRLFGLSEEIGDRRVQAEGYLAALPGPGPAAALLRAGAGARSLAPAAGLRIETLDFDQSGAVILGGVAPAGATVRVDLDGGAGAETPAGAHGRFSLAFPKVLPGIHTIATTAGGARASEQADIGPPAVPSGALPYVAARSGRAWRVDWLTPGGAPQATVIFDAEGTAR